VTKTAGGEAFHVLGSFNFWLTKLAAAAQNHFPRRPLSSPHASPGRMLPGEIISSASFLQGKSHLRLGDGLQKSGTDVASHFAGTLNVREGEAWLDVRVHRYIPAEGETVLGIVSEVHAENYNVDIGAPNKAVLPVLSFEGATKHNRPKLGVGSLVHCRVLKTSFATTEPLLTCVDKFEKAGGLGVLHGGYTYQSATHSAQKLLSNAGSKALEALGEQIAFELVIGFNGRVWVDAATNEDCVAVARTLAGGGALY
jgi:exosome complex component RRP40